MHDIEDIIASPYTSLSSAFVLGAIALSGRFSVNATKLLLVVAWAISAIGLHNQPLPIAIGTSAAIGVGLALLAYWFRPDVIPVYSGVLVPRFELLFSPTKDGKVPKLQIGNSGVF